jgi:YVTN family beta-propeller protein
LSPARSPGARRVAAALLVALAAAACSSPTASPSAADPSIGPASQAPSASVSQPPSVAPTPEPTSTTEPVAGVYGATVSGELDPRVADVPERVYVPNEESNDVAVIDPATFEVVGRFPVGDMPEHVNPDWGLEHLWVSNMNGGFLTKVDPMTSQPIEDIDLTIFPYALYYTLDGE